MKKAMFPGSFDPIHEGHIKIIKKALKIFEIVYVVVTFNHEKENFNNIKERFENVKEVLKNFQNVIVDINDGIMTAEWAKNNGINFLIRSARNGNDFVYELELAAGNHSINDNLETILIIPDYEDINFHSRLLKQKGVK